MRKPELFEFKSIHEGKGDLSFLEELKDIPFEVKRVYWIKDIPEQQARGGHAHKTGEQVIVCLTGEVNVILESVSGEIYETKLDSFDKGLYIPPMWWGRMVFSQKAVLLGLASDEFTEGDYIRNKSDFK